MTSKHSQAPVLISQGVFDSVKTFRDFEQRVSALFDTNLFQLYKQTTPMAFIKHARLLRKIDSPVFPQNQLFPKLLNKKDQSE